jgi:hypothetical protein
MRLFLKSCLLAVCSGALSLMVVVSPAYAVDKEQAVKAAFLYNFTKFIAWPADLSITNRTSINICVIGTNSLGDATKLFSQGSTPNLTITAKLLASAPTAAGECHIAFISASEKPRMGSLIKSLQQTSTLAVSDADGFAENGGAIGFINEKNKIRLVINKTAIEQAGLKVDAQLLEISSKVIR